MRAWNVSDLEIDILQICFSDKIVSRVTPWNHD